MNVRKQQRKLVLPAILMSLALSACASSGAGGGGDTASPQGVAPTGAPASLPVAEVVPDLKAKKPYRIAVLFPNAGDPYFQQKAYGYRDEAAKVGATVTFFDAGGYANIEKQISQIENVVQQKFDAIAIAVTSSTGTVPALEAAEQAGVLVVGDGVFPQSDQVIKRGEDSVRAGYNSGKFLCDSLNSGDSVGLLLGPPGIDLIKLREDGVKAGLAACPGVTVAKALNNLSDLPASLAAAENILQADPNVKGIYAFNSVVAQAVVQSLKSAGKKPGEVQVTAVDLDPDLEKLMKEGWVQHTSVGGSVLLGRVVVDTITEKLNGVDVGKEAYLVPVEVTPDTLGSFDRTILYPPAGS
ncbi:sugar ABC transporter substrate-binding protein [Cryobacterium tagatosivorans]|uniref:Sugar ABC transporter substrate-binding protein n=1 Tax=Cryobacterium tagatosivorans TaxID=1259199 RepID=A0A4R8UB87_9MICO|nr:sugar ABC transporter substrate-binding protein [Cryobacterium tagatosivorans]TFB47823.1 sugar ABC transporter substrate-binding protein [Cryobacterium tagatosivorans]